MRARRKSWAAGEIESNELIFSSPTGLSGSWHNFFGNSNPIHLEIGCGMGRFVVEMAQAWPSVNFVALERERNVLVSGARAAREAGLRIGFIIAEAQDLPEAFAQGEIGRIYLNFPDPWPNRNKWHKRRLTHSSFLQKYSHIMTPTAELHHRTDNAELFSFGLEQLSQSGFCLQQVSLDLHKNTPKTHIMTEYESKFHAKGMPIYYCNAYHNDI